MVRLSSLSSTRRTETEVMVGPVWLAWRAESQGMQEPGGPAVSATTPCTSFSSKCFLDPAIKRLSIHGLRADCTTAVRRRIVPYRPLFTDPETRPMSFIQAPPTLGNQYDADAPLRSLLARLLPAEVLREVQPSLREMGRLSAELYPAQLADRLSEPVLTQWDAWGNRVDRIELTPVWRTAERIAAEHGVVATAYERAHGRFSRIHQFALAYLFTPSTDIYACPLAMTDGAARVLLDSGNRDLIDRAVPHLTSRDPSAFWTSGQWMTETTGGSDISRTETVARRDADGR